MSVQWCLLRAQKCSPSVLPHTHSLNLSHSITQILSFSFRIPYKLQSPEMPPSLTHIHSLYRSHILTQSLSYSITHTLSFHALYKLSTFDSSPSLKTSNYQNQTCIKTAINYSSIPYLRKLSYLHLFRGFNSIMVYFLDNVRYVLIVCRSEVIEGFHQIVDCVV